MKIKTVLLGISMMICLSQALVFAEETRFESDGEIKVGVQQVEEKGEESSKFNEYRDIKDGFYLYKVDMTGIDRTSNVYLDFKGTNVGREDQNMLLRFGVSGKWKVEFERDDIPHNLSNKAKTPYDYQGNGIYTLPANAGITSITAASLAQDASVASFLNTYLHSTDLGTQRKKERVALSYSPTENWRFKLQYSDERKDGNQLTGAAIGDRPPRSLALQIAEPVDFATKEIRFEAEYWEKNYQVLFSHQVSDFTNGADSLTWQSMYYGEDSAAGTQDYNNDIGRTSSTYGRIALNPDNRYQNSSLTIGINMPLESRLTATVSKGKLEQDEALLPYSYSSLTTDWNSLSRLPRASSDAEINTTQYSADYVIEPLNGLNLKGFYRYYRVENDTKTDEWYYVTQDTASDAAAGTSFINQRKNLAFGHTRTNYGADASYYLKRVQLGLGYEKENIERDFREADTSEDIYKTSVKIRAANWLSLRLKYLYGDRDGKGYNGEVTDQSYHFTNAAESGSDRPYSAFGNHPDLRLSDVSDRKRNQYSASAAVNPVKSVNLLLSYANRKDDFDSGVTPVQPLAGVSTAVASAQAATTAGAQLGLLENRSERYHMDAAYTPTQRLSFNAFAGTQSVDSKQRGMAFDENNRVTASFDWNQSAKQWMVSTRDKTDTLGAGAGVEIIRDVLNFTADYSYSYGTVDIEYSGYGSDKSLNSNTYYYAFTAPEKVNHIQQTLNATLEYRVTRSFVAGLGYLYDKYDMNDWMQEPSGGWVETAGSDYFLRDSSRDNRWGNRLATMGAGPLAPSYENHVGMVTLAYRW